MVGVLFDQLISECPRNTSVYLSLEGFYSGLLITPVVTLCLKSDIRMNQSKVDQADIERFSKNRRFAKVKNVVKLKGHISTIKMNTEVLLHHNYLLKGDNPSC
jgi:hypothetical protein